MANNLGKTQVSGGPQTTWKAFYFFGEKNVYWNKQKEERRKVKKRIKTEITTNHYAHKSEYH